MDIKDFINDNKQLIIPEDKIDNLYIWTRVSKTQEVLMPIKSYYSMLDKAFSDEFKKQLSVVTGYNRRFKDSTYCLADFVTFTKNRDLIFTGNRCTVCSNNSEVLDSLAMFVVQETLKFQVYETLFPSLLPDIIDNKERLLEIFEKDILYLNTYGPFVEHKYRNVFFEKFLSSRCQLGKHTFVYTTNTSLIFGEDLVIPELAKKMGFKNISGLTKTLLQRRKVSYQSLMSDWVSCMKFKDDTFVYSDKEPKQKYRTVDRYK